MSRTAATAADSDDTAAVESLLAAREDEIIRAAVVASEGSYCVARNLLIEENILLPHSLYDRLWGELSGVEATPVAPPEPEPVGATADTTPANGTTGTGGTNDPLPEVRPTPTPTPPPTGDDTMKSTQKLPLSERRERIRTTLTRLGRDVTFKQASDELAGAGVELNGTTFHRHKRELFGHGGNGNGQHGANGDGGGNGTGGEAAPANVPGTGTGTGALATVPTGLIAILAAKQVAVEFGGVGALRRLLDAVESSE